MSACTGSDTEGPAAGTALPATAGLILAGLILAAVSAAAAPATTPSDLQRILEKAEKALDKAETGLRGRDPGRVSLLLKRADEELAAFEEASRLQALAAAIDAARGAARSPDPRGAAPLVLTARGIYPALARYAVLQQAEESSRAALQAAQQGDGPGCLEALDRFASAMPAPLLLKRLEEARQAVGRARTAMVRRDMAGGTREVGAVRRALGGLEYAGALGRALFELRIGSQMVEEGALIVARDQVLKALRDLRSAAEVGPDAHRDEVAGARDEVEEIWKRITRPQAGDAGRLLEVARAVQEIRGQAD